MEQAGLTPTDFGLKVRSHPDNLIVTARNKMGSAESFRMRIGLANQFIETWAISGRPSHRNHNLEAAKRLIENANSDKGVDFCREEPNLLWKDIPAETIKEFIRSWKNSDACQQTDPKPVVEYIERRNPDELSLWDVVLVGVQTASAKESAVLGHSIRCQQRTVSKNTTRERIFVSTKNRVASRGAEKTGLSTEAVQQAEKWWEEQAKASGKSLRNVPDRAYRRYRKKPLLMLHLLDLQAPEFPAGASVPVPEDEVVGWSISFPTSAANDPTVEYVVTTTWMRDAFGDQTDEEDWGDEDAD